MKRKEGEPESEYKLGEKRYFVVRKDSPKLIYGEFEGFNPKRVVVFSHGFGVNRYNLGLFEDIRASLVNNAVVVLFDFNEFDKDGNSYTPAYSAQETMLADVLSYIRDKFDPEEVDIIAHSQGSLVVERLNPQGIGKIILLASPNESPHINMQRYYGQREGTIIDEGGVSKIQRLDGTATYLPAQAWIDMKETIPDKLLPILKRNTELHFILARGDNILWDQEYSKTRRLLGDSFHCLEGATHDFAGDSRAELIDLIKKII